MNRSVYSSVLTKAQDVQKAHSCIREHCANHPKIALPRACRIVSEFGDGGRRQNSIARQAVPHAASVRWRIEIQNDRLEGLGESNTGELRGGRKSVKSIANCLDGAKIELEPPSWSHVPDENVGECARPIDNVGSKDTRKA